MIVPPKQIVIIPTKEEEGFEPIDFSQISEFIRPMTEMKKRDWFTSEFYKCLPLSIANTQGFAISIPYEIDIFWNGGSTIEDTFFRVYDDEKKFKNKWQVAVSSHFGHGIVTIHLPVMLKTPNGVNLMTISPPNFITPGFNTMTGVVESDNLRYTFTINLKINISNVWIKIPAHQPVATIIPVPRYFCDQFTLVDAYELFDSKQVQEEVDIQMENRIVDESLRDGTHKKWWDASYFDGMDIRGNKFNDHQISSKHKIVENCELCGIYKKYCLCDDN